MPPKPKPTTSKAGKKVAGKPKPSAKPRQPLPVAEQLKRLFTSLCAQIDGGHLKNAVKTCDKILRIDPTDEDALQTKLFLLLQTEQYATALSLLASKPEKVYERAYSLYRSQREEEAGEVLKAIKETAEEDRGVSHLEAQIAYRKGDYQAALDLYTHLLDTSEPQSEEHADILINLQASQQHVDFLESGYLRSLDVLPASIVSGLETAPAPTQAQSSISAAATVSSAVPATQPPKKAVRAKRVPKGVTPGVTPPPDPERWLKKSERSTFSQRKNRGGKGGASQGAAVEPATGTGPISSGGGGGGGGGGKSGKSKKRK